jgi:hypothetical protein
MLPFFLQTLVVRYCLSIFTQLIGQGCKIPLYLSHKNQTPICYTNSQSKLKRIFIFSLGSAGVAAAIYRIRHGSCFYDVRLTLALELAGVRLGANQAGE